MLKVTQKLETVLFTAYDTISRDNIYTVCFFYEEEVVFVV